MVILYQEAIMQWSDFYSRLELGFIILSVVLLLMLIIFRETLFNVSASLFAIFLIGWIFVIPIIADANTVWSGKNKYEVYFPNGNEQEYLSNYIVTEQHGQIYKIEDKYSVNYLEQ